MTTPSSDHMSVPRGKSRFATTHWSVVLDAGRRPSPRSDAALATLCQTYWRPLYAFARRQGHNPADARDLIQGFFTRLLEKRDLDGASPTRGRFRAFLLAALKHFMINQWDRSRAAKRGGGRPVLSIDAADAESRYRIEPAHTQTPETVFERQWALALLEHTQAALRQECVAAGKEAQFERLQGYLAGQSGTAPYRDAAIDLGMSEGAVKVAVHRLRRRFRDLLRDRIAQTVTTEEEIDDEVRALFEALRS